MRLTARSNQWETASTSWAFPPHSSTQEHSTVGMIWIVLLYTNVSMQRWRFLSSKVPAHRCRYAGETETERITPGPFHWTTKRRWMNKKTKANKGWLHNKTRGAKQKGMKTKRDEHYIIWWEDNGNKRKKYKGVLSIRRLMQNNKTGADFLYKEDIVKEQLPLLLRSRYDRWFEWWQSSAWHIPL